jgi:hypothetical protein
MCSRNLVLWASTPRSQVEEIAARLRADKIPADGIWLDIDYQYKYRPFTVNPVTFPDFPGLIRTLAAEHLHTILIADLHIADAPNQNYSPYDTGIATDQYVKENGPNGMQNYVGPVWPGPSVFPDFTRQQTRRWFGSLYKDFVAGFWDDMNEPAVFTYPTKTMPNDVVHRIDEPADEGFAPRTALHPEIHNIYGMENSRATQEGLLTLRPNLRPFVLTRASYAGGQRYAATWTGDNLSTWNHLRQTTPQLLNLGLSGFSMSGADVGGYGGSPSPDLLTKWLMLAAFQPIDRDHAAKGTRPHEPWVDGPAQEDIRRRYINQRYLLMPYLYTTAEETSPTGIPIIRPLFLEYPHATADNHPLDDDAPGEFFFGPSILVAESPLPDDIAPYEVHLPPASGTTTGPEPNSTAARPSPPAISNSATPPLTATPSSRRPSDEDLSPGTPVLGCWVAESEASWGAVFAELKQRGLSGVRNVVSDDHAGMVKAIGRHFQGAVWQRCQVHFARNALSLCGVAQRPLVLSLMRSVTEAPTREAARTALAAAVAELEKKAPKVARLLEEHGEEILGVYALTDIPTATQTWLRSLIRPECCQRGPSCDDYGKYFHSRNRTRTCHKLDMESFR